MNVLIVNQSCIDTLAALLLILVYATPKKMILDSNRVVDVLYCRLWYNRVLLWAAMFASSGGLMIITIERYLAVLHPIVYKV
jgi:hypothetical protein